MADRSPTALSRDSGTCHVGLVFSGTRESGCFEDRLGNLVTIQGAGFTVRRAALAGRRVVVVLAGDGIAPSARGTAALLAGHPPRWVISAGFASALDPRMHRGDILIADGVMGPDSQVIPTDLPAELLAAAHPPGLHVGRLLTHDQAIRTPDEKRRLGEQHLALAADTVSHGVAEVCRTEQVRFLAIRAIYDSLEETVPSEVGRLAAKKSAARWFGAAAGAIVRRPSAIKDLWGAHERALFTARRLAKFLESIIAQLP